MFIYNLLNIFQRTLKATQDESEQFKVTNDIFFSFKEWKP